MRGSSPRRDAPGPVEDRSPYPKAGYAALPRAADYPPPVDDYDRTRGRWEGRRDSMDSRWGGREDYDRRPPPPHWEDEYGRRIQSLMSPTDNRPTETKTITFAPRSITPTARPLSLSAPFRCPPCHARPRRTAPFTNLPPIRRLVSRLTSFDSKARRRRVEKVQAGCGRRQGDGKRKGRNGEAL